MWQFLVRMTAFAVLQVLIGGALFGAYLSSGDSEHAYLAAYKDKERLLAQEEGPRLVLLGGSNVALGMDSEIMGRRLPYKPVNMGLMTGIGTQMMLAQIEPVLAAGDVVVVSLEYDRWFERFEPYTVFRLIEENPVAWRDVPLSYVPELLDASLSYFGEAVRSVLGGGGRTRSHPPPYVREGFDHFGDFTAHRHLPTQNRLWGEVVLEDNLDEDLADVVELLNNFDRRVRDRGATVLVSFPPLPQDVYAEHDAELERLRAYLDAELIIPLLDSPGDMAYPRHHFFDTIYHLNSQGIARRADHLIPRLARVLRNFDAPLAGDAPGGDVGGSKDFD